LEKNKIYLIRHGKSIDNQKEVIQGTKINNGLCDDAYNELGKLTDDLKSKNIKFILSSPYLRTKQTAETIAKNISLEKIFYHNELREFDSGIFSGMSHTEAKEKYPNEYKIWTNRGDLDGIKNAETGNQLQARAIYVINLLKKQYVDQGSFLIVSHCGFMRSLINTMQNKHRCTPINYRHYVIHTIDKLKIKSKTIQDKNNKKLVIYKTKNGNYILKEQSSKKDISEIINLEEIKKLNLFPEILFHLNKDNLETTIYKFEIGKHKKGKFNKKDEENYLLNFTNLLKSITLISSSKFSKLTSIDEKIKKLQNEKTAKFTEIIENLGYKFENSSLIHYDLHRENILFNKNNIKFLDYGGFLIGDAEFMIGANMTSCFLLEGYSKEEVEEIIKNNFPNYKFEKIKKAIVNKAILSYNYFRNAKSKKEMIFKEKYENIINMFWSELWKFV